MQNKFTRKQNIVTGIMNALGFGRKRGGAGAVVAALAVCAIVASLTISVVGECPEGVSNDDVNFEHENNPIPVPVEKPLIQEPIVTCRGATPERLPC